MNPAEQAQRAWLADPRYGNLQLSLTDDAIHDRLVQSGLENASLDQASVGNEARSDRPQCRVGSFPTPTDQFHSREDQMQTGTLRYADGSEVQWEFVEHIPYEPSAYHWDEGIIVSVGSNMYFISLMSGNVYGASDEDEDELTRLIENAQCPEIDAQIKMERERDEQFWVNS